MKKNSNTSFNILDRHKENPFLSNMKIKIGTKAVKITSLRKENNILVNKISGEVSGTHVMAHKKVDSESFVKVFADYMSFTFELTKSGNKALCVVMWAVKETAIKKDVVILDKQTLELFHEKNNGLTLSLPIFQRGLRELVNAHLIAKTTRQGNYFINPNCIFNGDRIAFTTLIERKSKPKPQHNEENLELPNL